MREDSADEIHGDPSGVPGDVVKTILLVAVHRGGALLRRDCRGG